MAHMLSVIGRAPPITNIPACSLTPQSEAESSVSRDELIGSHARQSVGQRTRPISNPRSGGRGYFVSCIKYGLLRLDGFRGIEDDVTHALTLPGVGDVDESVGGLNDRGVAVFARFAFEDQRGLPVFAVS